MNLADPQSEQPRVAVLICTRDRGDAILATIRSLQANTYTNTDLVVVDQSRDQRTALALAQVADDPRLRYIHTATQGKSRANNLGLALIHAEMILMTDDDCEVPPHWIAEMTAALRVHPRVGAVFCDVTPGPHDPQVGFIPASVAERPLLITSLNHWNTCDGVNIGIGAGMAVRRSAVMAVGGFDPLFGPGSRFQNSDDFDVTLRLLVAGYQISRITHVSVIHHGFRTFAQGRNLMRVSMFSTAVAYGRLVRRGHFAALRAYLALCWSMVVAPILPHLRRRRVPPVLGRAVALLHGLITGIRLP